MAIAPNSSHFSDAQKKVALIDGQLANPGSIAAINTSNQTTTVQTTNSVANTSPTNVQDAGTTAVVNQQNVSAVDNSVNASSVTAVASAPVAAASSPVALLDNTSVQVVANGFSAPSGLTFDRNGNMYVANFVTSTIDRISPDGKRGQFSAGII